MNQIPEIGRHGPVVLAGDDEQKFGEAFERASPAEDIFENGPRDGETGVEPESPEAAAEMSREAMARRHERVRDVICELVGTARDRMLEARQALKVDEHYAEENIQFGTNQLPERDEEGQIILDGKAAHKIAGLTLGLFTDACTTVPPLLIQAALGNHGKPYQLEAKGVKDENPVKEQLAEDFIDTNLATSRWRREIAAGIWDLPKHGTAVWRQVFQQVVDMVQVSEGNWQERIKAKVVEIRKWPLLDLFVSHPGKMSAEDQRTVIWRDWPTLGTLWNEGAFLERSEELTAGDEGPEKVQIERRKPGYVDLEVFWRQKEEDLAQRFRTEMSGLDEKAPVSTGDSDKVPDEIIIDVKMERLALRGEFPVGSLIRMGLITADYLREMYGVEIKNEKGVAFEGAELARVADKLAWFVTTARGGEKQAVLELRPCPYRETRNELLKEVYIADGDHFYGLSADRLGRKTADSADQILNDVHVLSDFAAHPHTLYDEAAFEWDSDIDKGVFGAGGSSRMAAGGRSVEEIVKFLTKPNVIPQLMAVMLKHAEVYQQRVMNSQGLSGGAAITESKTFAAQDAQENSIRLRLGDVADRIRLNVIVRSIEWILRDVGFFLTIDEIEQVAMRVAGSMGLDAKLVLTQPGENGRSALAAPLDEEFYVRAAGSAIVSPEIASQLLLNVAGQAAALPNVDLASMYKKVLNLNGVEAEGYFKELKEPLSPAAEWKLIRMAGALPSVHPAEDAAFHYHEHDRQEKNLIGIIREFQASGTDVTEMVKALRILQTHKQRTGDLAQQQIAMQAQAQAEAEMAMNPPPAVKAGPAPAKTPRPKGRAELKSRAAAGAREAVAA